MSRTVTDSVRIGKAAMGVDIRVRETCQLLVQE